MPTAFNDTEFYLLLKDIYSGNIKIDFILYASHLTQTHHKSCCMQTNHPVLYFNMTYVPQLSWNMIGCANGTDEISTLLNSRCAESSWRNLSVYMISFLHIGILHVVGSQFRRIYQWLSTRMQYLQCISNRDTEVLHQAIHIKMRLCSHSIVGDMAT